MNDRMRRNAGAAAGDDQGEMILRHRPDQRDLDALFQGRLPAGHDGLADVAAFVEAVRLEATVSPSPTPELTAVLGRGIAAAPGVVSVADGPEPGRAQRPSAGPVRRVRPALGSLVASAGAMGLAAKAAVASTAVLAATAGAGFGGVLPTPVQASFDQVVGIDRTEEQTDGGDEVPAVSDDVPGTGNGGPDTSDATVGEDRERPDTTRDGPWQEGEGFRDGSTGDTPEAGVPGVGGTDVGGRASDERSDDARERADDPVGDVDVAPPGQAEHGAEDADAPEAVDQREAPPAVPPDDLPAGSAESDRAPDDVTPPAELEPEDQPAPAPGREPEPKRDAVVDAELDDPGPHPVPDDAPDDLPGGPSGAGGDAGP